MVFVLDFQKFPLHILLRLKNPSQRCNACRRPPGGVKNNLEKVNKRLEAKMMGFKLKVTKSSGYFLKFIPYYRRQIGCCSTLNVCHAHKIKVSKVVQDFENQKKNKIKNKIVCRSRRAQVAISVTHLFTQVNLLKRAHCLPFNHNLNNFS